MKLGRRTIFVGIAVSTLSLGMPHRSTPQVMRSSSVDLFLNEASKEGKWRDTSTDSYTCSGTCMGSCC
jgi:hypothetical protein